MTIDVVPHLGIHLPQKLVSSLCIIHRNVRECPNRHRASDKLTNCIRGFSRRTCRLVTVHPGRNGNPALPNDPYLGPSSATCHVLANCTPAGNTKWSPAADNSCRLVEYPHGCGRR